MTVEDQVKDILLQTLDIEATRVTPTAQIREQLGATSIDFVEFLTALENEFDLNIPDTDVPDLTTVQSTADYIKAKKV